MGEEKQDQTDDAFTAGSGLCKLCFSVCVWGGGGSLRYFQTLLVHC